MDAWSNGTAPLAVVGGFQLVAWLIDPLRVHTDLAGGKPMRIPVKVAAAAVNGGIWLTLALSLGHPRHPRAAAIVVPLAVYFTSAQWIFWWWPYLLGRRAGMNDMVEEHKEQLKQQPRLLPAIGDNLVPDIEHTLLQPLSLFATARAVSLFLQVPLNAGDKKAFVITGCVFSILPLMFALKSKSPLRELAPLLCSAQTILTLVAVHKKLR